MLKGIGARRQGFFRGEDFLPKVLVPADVEVALSLNDLSSKERRMYVEASSPMVDGCPLERDEDLNTDAVTAFSNGKLLGYLKYGFLGVGAGSKLDVKYMKSTQKSIPISWHLLIGILKVSQNFGVDEVKTDSLSDTGGKRFAQHLDDTFGTKLLQEKKLDVSDTLSKMSDAGVSYDNVKIRGN